MRALFLFITSIFIYCELSGQSWQQVEKILPEPYFKEVNSEYGTSVAISDNFVVIGEPSYNNEKGRAYVLHFDGTTWQNIAFLTASNGTDKDYFGCSVDISDSVIVIGAYRHDSIGSDNGAVYVFEIPETGWEDMTETAILTNSDASDNDYLGYSVAISNNTIIAGAYGNNEATGSAYIFEKPESGWIDMTQTAKLTSKDPIKYDGSFGYSVDISGDNIIVGGNGIDSNGDGLWDTAVYVYEKPESGWVDMTQTGRLTSSSTSSMFITTGFGSSVSISGNYIVVGAFSDEGDGSAFVFEKPESGWTDMTQTAKLKASDGESLDCFGNAVDISDTVIIIGAYSSDNNGDNDGSAYVFVKPVIGWSDMTQTAKLTTSDAQSNSYFGSVVGISGDVIISGAFKAGNAYFFKKAEEGWTDMTETQKTVPELYLNNTEDYFGYAVSIDDEYAVVGVPGGNSYKGCAYVLSKTNGGWQTIAQLSASDGVREDYFGYSVNISGSYIVVGATGGYDNSNDGGAAYLFVKPESGWSDMTQTAKLQASDGQSGDDFGCSVCISERIVVVGASRDDDKGSAYIFEKPDDGWTDMIQTAKLIASDSKTSSLFGYSVSISDSVVVIGAFGDNGNSYNSGVAYIFKEPSSGWTDITQTAKLTASDGQSYDNFGYSVDVFNNVVVIGAYCNDDRGSAYIFEKPENGWVDMTQTAKLTASEGISGGGFGYSVGILEDIIVIGTNIEENNNEENGSVYMFEKPETGWTDMNQTSKIEVEDIKTDYIVTSVSISGDNMIIGFPYDNYNGLYSGSVYIYEMKDCALIINQPENQTNACPNSEVIFYVKSENECNYRWQELTETNYQDLSETDNYSGVQSDSLRILVNTDFNNKYYRCIVSDTTYSDTSNVVVLLLDTEAPIITSVFAKQEIGDGVECEVALPDYTASLSFTDNCDTELEIFQVPNAGAFISSDTTVLLTVFDDMNNSDSITIKVSVLDNTPPEFLYVPNDHTIKSENSLEVLLPNYTDSITVTDNCSSDISILQSPEPGTSISGYGNIVTITTTDKAGNISQNSFKVNVVICNNINLIENICQGESFTIGEESFIESGNYSVTFQNQFGCDSIINLHLTVNPIPEIFIGNDTTILENQEIYLDAGEGYETYNWSSGEKDRGILVSDLNQGEYEYSVIVTNEYECSNSDTIVITVSIPDAITNIFENRNILIYPNPANNVVYIKSDGDINSELTISVFDDTGKLLINETLENIQANQDYKIDISKLNGGIYLLKLNNSESIKIHKVIKE